MLVRNASFGVLCVTIGAHVFLGCRRLEVPKKIAETKGCPKSRMRSSETPCLICIKFCLPVDISNIITCANFPDARLRGFWVAGSNCPFPIAFRRRPYNTIALPCECVICTVVAAVEWAAVLRNSCARIPVGVRRGRAVSALPQLTRKLVAHSVPSVLAALSLHLSSVWSWWTGRCVQVFRYDASHVCLSVILYVHLDSQTILLSMQLLTLCICIAICHTFSTQFPRKECLYGIKNMLLELLSLMHTLVAMKAKFRCTNSRAFPDVGQ